MPDDFRQSGGSPWGTPPGGSGGGASDIRLNGTELTDRILVAGGGGGGEDNSTGGSGGSGVVILRYKLAN